MRRAPFALACALSCALGVRLGRADEPPPLSADSPARPHWDRGIAHYTKKNYQGAIEELEKAFELDPHRDILFAWAQAERLSGDCASAVVLYRRYVATQPTARQEAAAQEHIARCEQALQTRPVGASPAATAQNTVPPSPSATRAPEVSAQPTHAEPPRAPWYKDTLGDVLVGTGIASLGAGASLFIVSGKQAVQRDESHQDYERRFGSAQRLRTAGVAGLVAGGTLIALGLLRYVLREP